MRNCSRISFFTAIMGVLLVMGFLYTTAIGSEKHGKKGRHGSKHSAGMHIIPAEYKASCGSCHMAYGAYLLPEASWRKMLDTLNAHFNTEVNLDAGEKRQVSDYLLTNAADRNGGKIGRKIMKHSKGYALERITTLPFFQRKHRKIDPTVFNRPSVGGMQNCVACHAGAEQGDFDDDRVSIPR